MEIKLQPQENLSGDSNYAQGFGRVTTPAKSFDPANQHQEACTFFRANGFVVLSQCLDTAELSHLNNFYHRTQAATPEVWGLGAKRKPHHRNQGLIYSQPLLDHPELDRYTQPPRSYPIVCDLLGGTDRVRFAEFNLRETPKNSGIGAMNFHHDAVTQDRLIREPYFPIDWLCAIHYLSNVGPTTPSFCVVPRSQRYETLKAAFDGLQDDYREVPIYGQAGTCVLYDTALYHTRLDGDGKQGRRTWHQYYARGGWLKSSLPTTDKYMRAPSPVLTDWNLFPERLALHPDPAMRLFFSHWNTAQGEWVASGFDAGVRKSMPRGEQ
ncbi:MAG: phytanoyl-CoA dioxygenase family protein [Proteobacteria bacterium]|nr:phytanoyl-CoA dioxygenase family protein [Pseudomonadota bacterium]